MSSKSSKADFTVGNVTLDTLGINRKDEMLYIPYFFHSCLFILFLHFKFLLHNDFNGFCFPILSTFTFSLFNFYKLYKSSILLITRYPLWGPLF